MMVELMKANTDCLRFVYSLLNFILIQKAGKSSGRNQSPAGKALRRNYNHMQMFSLTLFISLWAFVCEFLFYFVLFSVAGALTATVQLHVIIYSMCIMFYSQPQGLFLQTWQITNNNIYLLLLITLLPSHLLTISWDVGYSYKCRNKSTTTN